VQLSLKPFEVKDEQAALYIHVCGVSFSVLEGSDLTCLARCVRRMVWFSPHWGRKDVPLRRLKLPPGLSSSTEPNPVIWQPDIDIDVCFCMYESRTSFLPLRDEEARKQEARSKKQGNNPSISEERRPSARRPLFSKCFPNPPTCTRPLKPRLEPRLAADGMGARLVLVGSRRE
jgi:hypothetical protein